MPSDPASDLSFDISVLDTLACPVCLGGLRMDGARLVCGGCGRAYPIVDGIPVLIPERAVEPSVEPSQTVSSATSSTSVPILRSE
jgi:uncharacterized protein YbaR (Trm112 family)